MDSCDVVAAHHVDHVERVNRESNAIHVAFESGFVHPVHPLKVVPNPLPISGFLYWLPQEPLYLLVHS